MAATKPKPKKPDFGGVSGGASGTKAAKTTTGGSSKTTTGDSSKATSGRDKPDFSGVKGGATQTRVKPNPFANVWGSATGKSANTTKADGTAYSVPNGGKNAEQQAAYPGKQQTTKDLYSRRPGAINMSLAPDTRQGAAGKETGSGSSASERARKGWVTRKANSGGSSGKK